MLNELFELSQALDAQGLLPEPEHPSVFTPKACDVYVLLDEKGAPCDLRPLNREEGSVLWTHGKGNHNRFPAVRLHAPLLARDESDAALAGPWDKRTPPEKRAALLALDVENINAAHRAGGRPELLLSPWSQVALKPVVDDESDDLEALRRLLLRFPRDAAAAEEFAQAFARLAQRGARTANEAALDLCKNILVGTYDAGKDAFRSECLCYFDIDDQDVAFPVAHSRTRRALNRLLCAQAPGEGARDGLCDDLPARSALSGESGVLLKGSFPKPSFKVIGPSYLYSNNVDIPCLTRYGLAGNEAYPLHEREAQQMGAALGFLMQDAREGKTWDRFPGVSGKSPRLVVAWLEDDPTSEAELGAVFGQGRSGRASKYEALCENVLDYLEIKCKANPSIPVHLWLFETLDPGRRQLSYEQAFTAAELRHDIEEWCEAAENVPRIRFRVKVRARGKGEEVSTYRPLCPPPAALCSLARLLYRSSSSDKPSRVQDNGSAAFTVQQIYRLLLTSTQPAGAESFLRESLHTTVAVVRDLLGDAGSYQVLFKVQPFSQADIRYVCTAAALLGILLWKLNIRKERYMNGQSFLMGCLLKQADWLHREYCIEVRNKGDAGKALPPQLMGNAVFQIALDSPIEGMNRLEEKMRVYLGWAETAPSFRPKEILDDLETVACKLAQAGDVLPERFSAEERAQMLLGYLAGYPAGDGPGEAVKEGAANETWEIANEAESEANEGQEGDHE